MLGENHSLLHEFPEYKDQVFALLENDPDFSVKMKTYDELDKEIRELELNDSPIADPAMHEKKVRRSTLKDQLYQQLSAMD